MISKGGRNEIRPVHLVQFDEHGMSRSFVEQIWHEYLEMYEYYTECQMVHKKDHVAGYCSSTTVYARTRGRILLIKSSNVLSFLSLINDNLHWEFDEPLGEQLILKVAQKLYRMGLQKSYCRKTRKILDTIAAAVGIV